MQHHLSIRYLLASTAFVSFPLAVGFSFGAINDLGSATSIITALSLNFAMSHGFLILAQLLGLKFVFRWLFVATLATTLYLIYSASVVYTTPASTAHFPFDFGSTVGALVIYSIGFLLAEAVSLVLRKLCLCHNSAERRITMR